MRYLLLLLLLFSILLQPISGCSITPKEEQAACTISGCAPYNRDDYPTWTDADGDCQNTRAEVLISENTGTLTYSSGNCVVSTGTWNDPYTGQTFTIAADLDVDHLVPLAEAHRSGAYAWNLEKRKSYANYLADPNHLIAVSASANRSKGDQDPAKWLPPNTAYHVQYAQAWAAVKIAWGLTADSAEITALTNILRNGSTLPNLAPEAVCTGTTTCPTATAPTPTPTPTCCKVCTGSKACGDSCINVNYTCTKPAGCACNG